MSQVGGNTPFPDPHESFQDNTNSKRKRGRISKSDLEPTVSRKQNKKDKDISTNEVSIKTFKGETTRHKRSASEDTPPVPLVQKKNIKVTPPEENLDHIFEKILFPFSEEQKVIFERLLQELHPLPNAADAIQRIILEFGSSGNTEEITKVVRLIKETPPEHISELLDLLQKYPSIEKDLMSLHPVLDIASLFTPNNRIEKLTLFQQFFQTFSFSLETVTKVIELLRKIPDEHRFVVIQDIQNLMQGVEKYVELVPVLLDRSHPDWEELVQMLLGATKDNKKALVQTLAISKTLEKGAVTAEDVGKKIKIEDVKVASIAERFLKGTVPVHFEEALKGYLKSKSISIIQQQKDNIKKIIVANRAAIIGTGAFKEVVLAMNSKSKIKALAGPPSEDGEKIKKSVRFEREVEKEIAFSDLFKGNPFLLRAKKIAYKGRIEIVMPFANGGDLDRKIKNKTLTTLEIAEYMIDISAGVHSIHLKGWVHRDLKPENILLQDGKIKLTDYGTAAVAGNFKYLQGTLGYMPPESGDGPVSPLCDSFAIGKIFLEMLGFKNLDEYDSSSQKSLESLESLREQLAKSTSPLALNVLLPLIQPEKTRITVEEAQKRLLNLANNNLLVKEIDALKLTVKEI